MYIYFCKFRKKISKNSNRILKIKFGTVLINKGKNKVIIKTK